jgi:hypothetical protein
MKPNQFVVFLLALTTAWIVLVGGVVVWWSVERTSVTPVAGGVNVSNRLNN